MYADSSTVDPRSRFRSSTHIELGARSAEGLEALTRHARIRADAERRHLLGVAGATPPARFSWGSLWHIIDLRVMRNDGRES